MKQKKPGVAQRAKTGTQCGSRFLPAYATGGLAMSPMQEIRLSIDLGSPVGTLALHRSGENRRGGPKENRLLAEISIEKPSSHLEGFIGALDNLLQVTSLKLADINRMVTVSGPGSFTGLRIAFSSVKAIASVLEVPIDVLCGLEVRCLSWLLSKAPKDQRPAKIQVCTPIPTGRWVVALFQVIGATKVSLLEKQITTDIPTVDHTTLITDKNWTLRAAHLGDTLDYAQIKQRFVKLTEWVSMEPDYFGARNYTKTVVARSEATKQSHRH